MREGTIPLRRGLLQGISAKGERKNVEGRGPSELPAA
jgi:hypothetical protein